MLKPGLEVDPCPVRSHRQSETKEGCTLSSSTKKELKLLKSSLTNYKRKTLLRLGETLSTTDLQFKMLNDIDVPDIIILLYLLIIDLVMVI